MSEIPLHDKEKIIRIIRSVLPEVKIYLFGSRARGTHQKTSDIDLALDNNSVIKKIDISEIRELLLASYSPYKFDVVDIHAISGPFKEFIEKEKVLWKDY